MASKHAFKNLDSNEKEFDRIYMNLDTLIEGKVHLPTDKDLFRKYLKKLNKLYTKTSLSAQVAYENLSRLEAREIVLVSDLETAVAEKSFSDKEVEYLLLELHNLQLKLSSTNGSNVSAENVKRSLEKLQEERKSLFFLGDRMRSAMSILTKESQELKSYVSALQDKLYGTRMAAKYLYKELAGRIQQIQLLCQKMDGPQHEKLWNTLESEILLCRHKTVNLSCRNRLDPPPPKDQCNRVRHVTVHRGPTEELGISITGGLEYGVPILISEIIPNQVVHCSGEFYIGDAILAINGNDLRDKRHHEAADILAAQQGKLEFDLLFLHDDPLDELSQICVDGEGHKFRLYDENRILPSRFLFQVHQQLKENHTNAGNKISEPRPIMENISEYRRFLDTRDATCRKITQLTKPLKNRNGSEEFFNIYESYLWRPNSLEGPAYGRKLPGVEKKSLNEVYLPQVLPLSDRSKSSILAG